MKYIRPEELAQSFKQFAPNMAVTHGQFEFNVPGLIEDMEWNHMDQLHRPHIHKTYQEVARLACGKDFAISLTRWGKFPLFITVSDIRIKPGLFYQCMTIAGIVYVHFVISMEERNEVVYSKLEWHITSHKWLKFLHKPLHKKFLALNIRLQDEDDQIRKQRYQLRKKGYEFSLEPMDYYSSNNLRHHTIYPNLPQGAAVNVSELLDGTVKTYELGKMSFLIKRKSNEYLIWPEVCPHEGANLALGKECDVNKIQCPWHGLKFSAVVLSSAKQESRGFGFNFKFDGAFIHIDKILLAKDKDNTVKEVTTVLDVS
jgi:hypothetical protein